MQTEKINVTVVIFKNAAGQYSVKVFDQDTHISGCSGYVETEAKALRLAETYFISEYEQVLGITEKTIEVPINSHLQEPPEIEVPPTTN